MDRQGGAPPERGVTETIELRTDKLSPSPAPSERGFEVRRLLGPFACLVLLIAAWLLLPGYEEVAPERPPLRVCLVDASASAVRPRPGWLRWVRARLRDEAVEAQTAGEEFAVLLVARQVRRAFGPGVSRDFLERLEGRDGAPFDPRLPRGEDDATRLAAGLEVALSMTRMPGRRPGRVVLLGSGRFTGEDPAPALTRLSGAGVAFERRPPEPPALGDLALLELFVPPWIEAEAPLGGVAHLSYRAGRYPVLRAELVLTIRGPKAERVLRMPLELPPAGGRFELPLELGRAGFGRTQVVGEALLELQGPAGGVFGDPVPENNRVEASTRARGELIVAGLARSEDREALGSWLAPSGRSTLQGVQWVFEDPERIGAMLGEVDAVVAFDLPAMELPGELLEDFLRRGGGLLLTQGWGFLRDWFPGDRARGLARRLPLEPAPYETPPREVVLLVDGSGSMEGERFELVRRAALDLVAAALPSDRVTLRFFRTRLGEAILIKERTQTSDEEGSKRVALEAEEAARRLLDLEVPEGSTFVLSSLEHFAAESYPEEVLALLLTDGEDREGIANLEARTRELHARLREGRKRVVAIAIDAQPRASRFLAELVPAGDKVLEARRLDELVEIFRREVSGAQVRTGEIGVGPRPRSPGSLAFEVEAQGAALPPLERMVRNRARAGAEVLWESDQGEPVLAVMRTGAGRSAMLSTLPAAGWASNYCNRLGLGEPRLFGALVRWLARRSAFDESELEARCVGDAVQVAGFGPEWPLLLDGELVSMLGGEALGALVLRPPGARRSDSLLGNDVRTVRTGRLPAGIQRSLADRPFYLRLPAPEPGALPVVLPLSGPRSAEFAHEEKELLEPSQAPPRQDVLRSEKPVQRALGPFVLGLGLALVFLFALLRTR